MHENPCDNICLTFRCYLIGCVIDAPGRRSDPERRNNCEPPGGPSPSDRLARDGFGPATIQPSKALSIQSQVDKFMAADFSNVVSSDDLCELDVLVYVAAPELSARLLFDFIPVVTARVKILLPMCVACRGFDQDVFLVAVC